MKTSKSPKVLYSILLLSVCSCESNITTLHNDQVEQKLLYTYHCANHSCVPEVEIWGDNQTVEISWVSEEPGNDHTFLLSCSGADGQIYRTGTVGNQGTWFFSLTDMDAYSFQYTLSCTEGYYCEDCRTSGSFHKSADEETGSMGSYYECGKEYYTYSIQQDYRGVRLVRDLEAEEPNPKRMDIDKITVYKISTSYSEKIKLLEEKLEPVFPGEYLLPSLPSDMNTNYKVVLTNEQCEQSIYEHYLCFSYHSISGDLILPMRTETVNQH